MKEVLVTKQNQFYSECFLSCYIHWTASDTLTPHCNNYTVIFAFRNIYFIRPIQILTSELIVIVYVFLFNNINPGIPFFLIITIKWLDTRLLKRDIQYVHRSSWMEVGVGSTLNLLLESSENGRQQRWSVVDREWWKTAVVVNSGSSALNGVRPCYKIVTSCVMTPFVLFLLPLAAVCAVPTTPHAVCLIIIESWCTVICMLLMHSFYLLSVVLFIKVILGT